MRRTALNARRASAQSRRLRQFRLFLFVRLELERVAVDAIALPGRLGPVGKDMPEVAVDLRGYAIEGGSQNSEDDRGNSSS